MSGSAFRERRLQPELMDQPGLDAGCHRQALAALRRVNWLSRTAGCLWPHLRRVARAQPERALRVLDIASGGGDVAVALWRRARRAGIPIEIVGLDFSAVAVAHARELADQRGAAVEFRVGDALGEALPAGFDAIVTSLFLHHLPRPDAVRLLAAMHRAAGRLMLVSDLRRSVSGYWLAQGVCRLVSRSAIVHVDGPRSVEGAFTLAEVRQLAAEAGLTSFGLSRRWPSRFLLAAGR